MPSPDKFRTYKYTHHHCHTLHTRSVLDSDPLLLDGPRPQHGLQATYCRRRREGSVPVSKSLLIFNLAIHLRSTNVGKYSTGNLNIAETSD